MPFTIGCAGRARHGKGSTAEIIKHWADTQGVRSQIISFADPLKDFLTQVIGRSEPFRGDNEQRSAPVPEMPWSRVAPALVTAALAIWPDQDLNINPTGRQLMQLFGTETVRRNFSDDAWVMIADTRAKRFDGITIIDDVRFTNEARPRSIDFGILDVVLKIVRPDQPKINHPSEDAVDLIPMEWFARVFDNTGDLETLRGRVYGWLEAAVVIDETGLKTDRKNDASRTLNHQGSVG